MYQRFLFFGGSKHGERQSIPEQEMYFHVYFPAGFLIDECGERNLHQPEEELYCKQKWRIDGKTEFVFVLSSLIETETK
jgi:hypothetical protein